METVDKHVNGLLSFVDNEYISAGLILFLILYASLAAPKLPSQAVKYFDYTAVKLLMFFLIVYISKKNVTVAIVASLAVMATAVAINQIKFNKEMLTVVKNNNKLNSNKMDVHKMIDKENIQPYHKSCNQEPDAMDEGHNFLNINDAYPNLLHLNALQQRNEQELKQDGEMHMQLAGMKKMNDLAQDPEFMQHASADHKQAEIKLANVFKTESKVEQFQEHDNIMNKHVPIALESHSVENVLHLQPQMINHEMQSHMINHEMQPHMINHEMQSHLINHEMQSHMVEHEMPKAMQERNSKYGSFLDENLNVPDNMHDIHAVCGH